VLEENTLKKLPRCPRRRMNSPPGRQKSRPRGRSVPGAVFFPPSAIAPAAPARGHALCGARWRQAHTAPCSRLPAGEASAGRSGPAPTRRAWRSAACAVELHSTPTRSCTERPAVHWTTTCFGAASPPCHVGIRRGDPRSLVGDSLQALAFSACSPSTVCRTIPPVQVEMVKILAVACGSRGHGREGRRSTSRASARPSPFRKLEPHAYPQDRRA